MKDFPVFSTENGVGSLVLKEVPYTGKAYLRIQSSQVPLAFLADCVAFARAVGAKAFYAAGQDLSSWYKLHATVCAMACPRESLPPGDAALFPVTHQTLARWGEIYNRKMENVPNAAYMSHRALEELLQKGEGYFVHKGEQLLGIGTVCGNTVGSVASLMPGAGKQIVCTLANAVFDRTVKLEVAAQNQKAVALYESLGFVKTKELSRWYQIF